MKLNAILLPLVVSVVFVGAAQANYFHNPRLNINYSLGSAGNPKPIDVRENRQPQISALSAPTAIIRFTAQEVQYFQMGSETGANKRVAVNSSSK